MVAPYPQGGMVGKKELLQWASQASDRPITKFDELKDGDVLLRCMKETWPAAYDRCRRKGQPRSVSGNFELMGSMFEHLDLPKSVLDTRGIQHASFKSCYNFLVMAFFLKNLATHSDFSVDFTHPVDSKLAAFLQAPESVASLHKGGALAPPGSALKTGSTHKPTRSSSVSKSRSGGAAAERPGRPSRRDDALESASAATLRAEAALANEDANRRALLAATSVSPVRRRLGKHHHGEEEEEEAAALPPAPDENTAPSRERSALQQARDARRKQAAGASNASGPPASGSRRRVDALLGRAEKKAVGPVSSSRPRRPRLDGSSSDYGTSDGDMAPGPSSSGGTGGLTRGAVAEILARPSPKAATPEVESIFEKDASPFTDPSAASPDAEMKYSPVFRSMVKPPSTAMTSPPRGIEPAAVGTRRERSSAPPAPLLVPGSDGSGRLWANADAADRGETQLAEARFEVETLRRLLDASKRERDLLERRFDVELEAREARYSASARAGADDARARIAARELQLAAERNTDQRAYLHELRLVAEEVAAAGWADANEDIGANDEGEPGSKKENRSEEGERRVKARLDAVRGREVRALEERIASLESERARLSEALRAASEAARSEGDGGDVDAAAKSPAAAHAIRRERVKSAELAEKVRVLEATLEGERAGRERERVEFTMRLRTSALASQTSVGSDGVLTPMDSSPGAKPFASPLAVGSDSSKALRAYRVSRTHSGDAETGTPAKSAVSGETYQHLLAEQRGERKIVRLEAELSKTKSHNEALRRQMRAVQEARFDDIEHVPPTDPAEAEAMLKAEEEAHRVGAIGASADAAELLKAIDALRVAASANGGGEGDVAAAALAAAADAEKATWRRATAAAVAQRRVARLRAESRAWRAALEDERKASREAGRTWKRIKGDLEVARDEALEAFRRERATGGVRASLAEEAAELARDEARTARKDAADAFRARDAATGASAGALREARDEAAKLRLRESHWVGLIGCHRESSRVSRELAELATLHGGESARLAVDAAAGPGAELARRRAAAEAEAESHVEAVKAIADMIDVRDRLKGTADALEFGRAVDRAEAAEASLNATRDRLHAKSEEAADLALKAKRHELRAQEESAERTRAQRRAEGVAAELQRLSDESAVNQRRASEEMAAAREELARLREAFDDRDAALGAGAELVERDPELARTVSEGKAALDEAARDAKAAVDGIHESAMKAQAAAARASASTPKRGFFGFGSREGSSALTPSPKGGPRGTPGDVAGARGGTPGITKGTIASPGAVAAAVAAATQALVSPKDSSPGGGVGNLNALLLDTSPIIPAGPYGTSVGHGGEGGESPYDFLVAGKTTPLSALNPLDDLAAAASAFRTGPGKGGRNRADESFGSSAPLHSTSKRAAVKINVGADTDEGSGDDEHLHKMSGGSPVAWLGTLLSPSASKRASAIPLSEVNTDADDTDVEVDVAPVHVPGSPAQKGDEPAASPGLFKRLLRRSPSPGKTRPEITPGALENPRVHQIRRDSQDGGTGMSRDTSSENLSVMTGPESPPDSATSSLPGADEFLHKADKRLDIKVERSWFGLGTSPSPVKVKVRTGDDSDTSDDESPTSKMTATAHTQPKRSPKGGGNSKQWPSPASVVKLSRAENRAAAEFIAAAEEAAKNASSPGKGKSGVLSPAQRREERKRAQQAIEQQASPGLSELTGGSLTTGGGLPTGSDFFNQAQQEKSWMQGLGSPSPVSKRRDLP